MSHSKNLKLIVTGYAGHGKDTVCMMLTEYGYTFESSSYVLAEELILPKLAPVYGYTSLAECYTDRVNHRKEWHDLLVEYNTPDLTKLGKLIFSKYDIYCGLRNRNELLAMKEAGLFDLVIWVDALDRLPPESTDSISITIRDANLVLDNNGNLKQLIHNVHKLESIIEAMRIHMKT